VAQVARGRRVAVLVELRHHRGGSVSRQAREYLASDEAIAGLLAVALLVGSPVTRTIGAFFLAIQKPGVPARLFTDEGGAIAWLRGFLA